MKIVILSPHRNDAAFSLALAIKGWLAAGHRVTVLGVFTRSTIAPYSDSDTVHPNDLLTYVSAMRRKEDGKFNKLLPKLQFIDLNLKDATSRLRCSSEELYTLEPRPDDTAVAKLQKALAKLDAERSLDALVLPLGLGHHVDHLVVRNAALAFAATHPCAFYEDLPDAIRTNADIDELIQHESAAIPEALAPVIKSASDPDSAVAAKRRMVSVYASQVNDEEIAAISQFALRYQGGERIWANSAWLASGL